MSSSVSFRDTIRTNQTLNDMLLSVLLGMSLETDWMLDFSFTTNPDSSKLLGEASFIETPAMCRSNLRGFPFTFRVPDGLTNYEGLELLFSEFEPHCTAMTQGLVSSERGYLVHSKGESWSKTFRKRAERDVGLYYPQTTPQARAV
jgi:hypothetical protein